MHPILVGTELLAHFLLANWNKTGETSVNTKPTEMLQRRISGL
jgi:hypothetical protein